MKASKERNQEQMKKKTLGMMIASLRKENGMTQLELAEKMLVTDKAVSKWERDLSCPDVNTIPKLAEVFNISVDELMQVKNDSQNNEKKDLTQLIHLIMKGVALAMGVAVVVLSVLKKLDVNSGMGMLGLGLACITIPSFEKKDEA
jgi:transcriptional regulator with XRE-family HTH domain